MIGATARLTCDIIFWPPKHTAPLVWRSRGTVTDALKKWTAALAYVGAIYATLGVAPRPLAVLRAHNCLRLTLAIAFLACVLLVLNVMRFRSRNLWNYFGFALTVGAYLGLTRFVQTPEEQVHFVQYGLVGVLFLRAVRTHTPTLPVAYAVAFALAALAGWLDEVLQGHVPGRHYDVRDIQLNAVSALLGLVVHRLSVGKPTETPARAR